jgi:hypothetical protein
MERTITSIQFVLDSGRKTNVDLILLETEKAYSEDVDRKGLLHLGRQIPPAMNALADYFFR